MTRPPETTEPRIGVSIQTVTPELAQSFGLKEAKGALVSDVAKDGPAEAGGIKAGDIIVVFDGNEVKTANDLPRFVAETPVGKTVDVGVIREKREIHVTIRVAELTEAKLAAQSEAPEQSFGMKVDKLTPQWQQRFNISASTGVVVVAVEPGSMADEAGIQPGDIIREVNRKPVKNLAGYTMAMSHPDPGEPLLVLLKRGKQTFYVTMQRQ